MRRKDREMPEEFSLYVVDKCQYAVMATISEDGSPYCVPLSIARKGSHIYFHCAHEGQKISNLRHNSNVCIACVGDTQVPPNEFSVEYESAIVRGIASEVTDEQEKTQALRMICLRHTPNNMDAFDDAITQSLSHTAVWRVEIASITGKRIKYDPQGKEMKFGRME